MNELTEKEMMHFTGGGISSDTMYSAGITVGVLALGALLTIATGGAAAPAIAIWGLGILGTGANLSAIAAAQ